MADQDVLGNEMINFTEYRTKMGTYAYEAKTGHDDVVNCLLLSAFVYGKLLGNFREFSNATSGQRAGGMQVGPRKPRQGINSKPRYSF